MPPVFPCSRIVRTFGQRNVSTRSARRFTQPAGDPYDFIVDAYQVYEAAAMGADCILLIVGALEWNQMLALEAPRNRACPAVLVESHDAAELDAALTLQTPLIGINNRDLRTFNVSLATTTDLLTRIPVGKRVITESGIPTRDDVTHMRSRGVNAYLVGKRSCAHRSRGAALANCLP